MPPVCSLPSFLPSPVETRSPSPRPYLTSFISGIDDSLQTGMSLQSLDMNGIGFFGPVMQPLGVSGYDTSSAGSWSPITPATPSTSERIVGSYPDTPGTFYSPPKGSPPLSSINPLSETGWMSTFDASGYEQPVAPGAFNSSCINTTLMPMLPLGIPHQANSLNVMAIETMENPKRRVQTKPAMKPLMPIVANKRTERKKSEDGPLTRRKKPSKKTTTSNDGPEEVLGPSQILRTAPRKSSEALPGNRVKVGETSEQRLARTSHNRAEKHYRDRLHGCYARLLETLPGEMATGNSVTRRSGSRSWSSRSKRVSKVEVLQKASQHILSLHHDVVKWKREISELQEKAEKGADSK